jgi:carnitine O-acetyltransferase
MLRFQADLERLPVPELEETCALYLEMVRPLLDKPQFDATRGAVSEFAEAGGPGETLQRRLLRWSDSRENWLEPFWDDWYLVDDTPLVVNVSPAFALAGGGPQVGRASRLLAAALQFSSLVEHEVLEPDVVDCVPQCMREYSRLLASTRIPGATGDVLEQHAESRHVVVVRGNRFFSLEVLDENRRPHAVADLERGLQRIVDSVETPGLPLGVLTTDRRRSWARVRERHLGHGPAYDALRTIESAILVLVLECGPAPDHARSREAARLFLHGDARGRWFDKSLQLVVAANGVAGICMEHAGFDGSTLLRFAEFLVAHEGTTYSIDPGRNLEPEELRFELTEATRDAIADAERRADVLVRRTDLALLDFRDFGRGAIVRHGLSPDGFVQMAFQLASYTLTGEFASTYESVSTKRFLHGRTEAMRSVSTESVAFVRSLRDGSSRAVAEKLLRASVSRHRATVARCREGRGVERHLLGLRRMLGPDEPLPSLYADEGYSTLTRSVLSTSALPSSPGVELTCFGPVVEDGLGLSYTIHDDRVCCAVTSFNGLAMDFAAVLERALFEMDALLGGGAH